VRARKGEFSGIVTMYHDQGQVAHETLGIRPGVTVAGGLPIVVTTQLTEQLMTLPGKELRYGGFPSCSSSRRPDGEIYKKSIAKTGTAADLYRIPVFSSDKGDQLQSHWNDGFVKSSRCKARKN